MAATELHDLEALLERALPDPKGFLDRVVGQLLDRLAVDTPGTAPAVVAGYDAKQHQRLEDRSVVLAAALGACECWGEEPSCDDCRGSGSPGWLPPDPELFDELVRPADPASGRRGGRARTDPPDEGDRR